MRLKEFKVEVPGKGEVDVSFYLHFDTKEVTVSEIKLRTNFESGLPRRAWLKQDNGKWKLFDEHPTTENNDVIVKPEFLDDELSNTIVERILAIEQEEK